MVLKTGMEPLIRKTDGICGGDACIRRMRMPVWLLVEMRRARESDQEILDLYEGMLSQEDLAGAWRYAEAHADEIEQAIRDNEEA